MRKIFISLVMMLGCNVTSLMAQGVETFVTQLLEQYPQARLLDIYKSCFQDYMGAEHLVGDTASVRGYLERELATASVEEMLPWYCEACGAQGHYVRVSLRAVLEGHVSAEALLYAFIASANDPDRPDVTRWVQLWQECQRVIDQMGLALPHYDEDRHFIEEVLAQGKYAISHSPDYREAYAPHYRIVKREIFEKDIKPLLPEQ